MNTRAMAFLLSWTLLLALLTLPASASDLAGQWEIPDEDTGKPSAIITFSRDRDGGYRGVLTKVFTGPGEDPKPRCTRCQGPRRDQPVEGLEVIWDLKPSGRVLRGRAMHPDDGEERGCVVELGRDGQSLTFNMRLFVVFNFSQVWRRVQPAQT